MSCLVYTFQVADPVREVRCDVCKHPATWEITYGCQSARLPGIVGYTLHVRCAAHLAPLLETLYPNMQALLLRPIPAAEQQTNRRECSG